MATQKLELTWIGKEKTYEIEPRILIENPNLSYEKVENLLDDGTKDNMLIHGDNLLALEALRKKYSSSVKCIYIDPPYNTGSAFEHYDDNVEHSTWLSLMRERLLRLKDLLTDDGIIYIQIDDIEHAYLKNYDGTWSHKPGGTAVTDLDRKGNLIYDPKSCDRTTGFPSYSEFVGFYQVNVSNMI